MVVWISRALPRHWCHVYGHFIAGNYLTLDFYRLIVTQMEMEIFLNNFTLHY